MRLKINGEDREVAGCDSVEDLLRVLEIDPARVAVLVDENVVPRTEHAAHRLCDRARIELVTFLAGG